MIKAQMYGHKKIRVDHNGPLGEQIKEFISLFDVMLKTIGPETKIHEQMAVDWLMDTLEDAHEKYWQDAKREAAENGKKSDDSKQPGTEGGENK